MFKCLCFVLQQKVGRLGHIDTKRLRPFGQVLIVGSSSWEVSEKLHLYQKERHGLGLEAPFD